MSPLAAPSICSGPDLWAVMHRGAPHLPGSHLDYSHQVEPCYLHNRSYPSPIPPFPQAVPLPSLFLQENSSPQKGVHPIVEKKVFPLFLGSVLAEGGGRVESRRSLCEFSEPANSTFPKPFPSALVEASFLGSSFHSGEDSCPSLHLLRAHLMHGVSWPSYQQNVVTPNKGC